MFLNLLMTFVVVLLSWFAIYRWRRRRFYELAAKFQGPPTVPIIGNALSLITPKQKNIMSIFDGGYKFESPVKLWILNQLIFVVYDPVNFETILNSPHALEKQVMYKFSNSIGIGLFNANVPMWKKHKKIILPTFNQKILNGFVEIFSAQANVLVNNLEKHAGKGIFDVYELVNTFTIHTLTQTVMERKIDSRTAEYLGECCDKFMSILCSRMSYNFLYYFDFTFKMTAKGREFFDIVHTAKKLLQDLYIEKIEDFKREKKEKYEIQLNEVPIKKNSFLRQLAETSNTENGLTYDEIFDESNVIAVAGTDTSATMNSYILMMLGMHPEIQEKVYNEVIDTVGLDRPIEYTDLPNLSYTELVIKETLRILPVGPVIGRSATGDIELKDGRVIPKGASIVFSIIHAHRNRDYWPDPMKFDPLRFLPEECAKRHRYCFLPFAGGPRKCIGITYAMMSMKVAIATIVRNYVVKTCYKQPKDIKIIQHIASKPVNGFLISLEKRTKKA